MATAYYVEKQHTLLYKQDGDQFYGILAGKLQLGGRNWIDGMCLPRPDDLRPATLADFDYFNVCSRGHLT